MAKKEHYTDPLLEGRFYHIYNRSIAEGILFKSDENRAFFLKKCLHFFGDHISLYAYCLLNNHFHLLIRVEETENDTETSEIEISGIFRRLFQSYALSFNSYYGRKGTLFQRPFIRALIETEQNFTNVIFTPPLSPHCPFSLFFLLSKKSSKLYLGKRIPDLKKIWELGYRKNNPFLVFSSK